MTYEPPSRTRIYIAALAVFTAAVALACSLLIGGRYETAVVMNGIVRTDRLTGEIVVCAQAGCQRVTPPL